MRIVAPLLLLLVTATVASATSRIKVDADGGYNGIVVRVADDGTVPEDKCPEIVANIKVRRNAQMLPNWVKDTILALLK